MKRKYFIVLLTGIFFIFSSLAQAQKKDLPERYRKWLEEEVVYIITPLEKEVFLKLKTDRERDLFMEAFWKHRDPNPATPENEFKEEHYRRLNYVNHFFGRGTPKPGWKTDRGRIYIMLGEPRDIQRFEGKSQVYPCEIWFYQGKTEMGLPPGFNLVFFQDSFTGEYKLYSPLQDGPQALLTSYYGDPMNYLKAYQKLRDVSPQLADVSLSLIPGERQIASGRPSLSSDLLIQKVESTPQRQFKDRYARKFLEYKDIIEVEYTANYINSESLVKVIKDRSGLYFVHYAVEPERLSVSQYEDKYYAKLKINGKVSDEQGNNVYQFEKDISLEFDEKQMKNINRRPLCIEDMFPLIPGNYELSILVKNEVSKEFTSLERNIVVPGEENGLQMTSLILGYKMEKDIPPQNRLRPFQAGDYRLYFQANRVFLKEDDLILAFQVHGLNQELKQKTEIQYSILKSGEEFKTISRDISEYENLPQVVEKFSLKDFPPAHYRVRVSLVVDEQEVISSSEEFDVTYAQAIARPWIYSKLLPATNHPVYSYLIGTQYLNSNKLDKAKHHLEKAFQQNPQSVGFALNLARVYQAQKKYRKIIQVLDPFLNIEKTEYQVYFMAGKAYQNLSQYEKAIEIFDQAISRYGVNTNLLNSIGECYSRLGNIKEALKAWEKSLEINADQPRLKKNVEALKEKK